MIAMGTIYLSSTYEDLKEYRHAVVEALRTGGHKVITMKEKAAKDQRLVKMCLRKVANTDVYIGLFAFRYGYVPPTNQDNAQGLSITELEFREAQRLRKPCLTFVASEEPPWPPKFIDALQSERIYTLRQFLLTEKFAPTFSSPQELAALVLAAVTKLQETKKKPETQEPKKPDTSASMGGTWDIEENGSPYPGLMHFSRKHAPVFFGRDREVRDVLNRINLQEGQFIIVSGDSGVGKSSLVEAGILPKLEERGLPNSESCESVRMVPGQSQSPFSVLMAALEPLVTRAGLRLGPILKDLERAPNTLVAYLKHLINNGSQHQTLLLVVDQMEELFTSQNIEETNEFLTALYQATQEKVLWVLATIRRDSLHNFQRHPKIAKVLNGQGHYVLAPVEPLMMQEMIMKPAQCAGLSISEQFARRLINDTREESANLSLLAFILNTFFGERANYQLSETIYNSVGGVPGAIADHIKTVEEKIQRELDCKTEELLPNIFPTFVNIQKGEGIPTRRTPLVSGFKGKLRKVVALLVKERLLKTEGEGESATVSITHETFFQAWPALREYVETQQKALIEGTPSESHIRKWATTGKALFSERLSRRQNADFKRDDISHASLLQFYLRGKRRTRWLWTIALALMLPLLIGLGISLRNWEEDFTFKLAVLKTLSTVVSIHVEPNLVAIPSGTFRQGDVYGEGYSSEQPLRDVTINKFGIGRFEVTFEEYDRFAAATNRPLPRDEGWGRGSRPVINVSWEDAATYAQWLSEKTGNRYRLPTETEWEYAARKGGKNEIWAGTSKKDHLADYAWFNTNSTGRTQPVGIKNPNGLGLRDMSGNVWEWVQDCWHETYTGAPTNGTAWLEAGGGNCGMRLIRGGAWTNYPMFLRSSFRNWYSADTRSILIGFRLAQDFDDS